MGHRGARGRHARGVYCKRAVPRHRMIVASTADRLERAIESRERQGAQRDIAREWADYDAERREEDSDG